MVIIYSKQMTNIGQVGNITFGRIELDEFFCFPFALIIFG